MAEYAVVGAGPLSASDAGIAEDTGFGEETGVGEDAGVAEDTGVAEDARVADVASRIPDVADPDLVEALGDEIAT
ncbi:MAG: hypothetical protein WEG36_09665, partial [Gemmatimonadota bacterium]